MLYQGKMTDFNKPVTHASDGPEQEIFHASTSRQRGLTLFELSLAIGLVSLLLAMILGFGRHANASIDIVKARTELGEYSQALHQWYLLFQQYPYERTENGQGQGEELETNGTRLRENLKKLMNNEIYARVELPQGGSSNIYFSSFLTKKLSLEDPWGTPYIYYCDQDGRSYTLFSCGPDKRSEVLGDPISTSTDDIFFER